MKLVQKVVIDISMKIIMDTNIQQPWKIATNHDNAHDTKQFLRNHKKS